MRRALALGSVVLIVFGLAPAQKKSTLFGDAWTGEVVAADDDTREITIRYEDKGVAETFTGVLVEGFKAKMKDGNVRVIKVSEIPRGTRVRVFAKTREQKTAAGKIKINSIYRIDFLGKDEWSRLREALGVGPSAALASNDKGGLPASNPLKLHLASENERTADTFKRWLSRWNKEQAAKHGSVELVASFAEAEVSLVVLDGAEDVLFTPSVIDADNRVHSFPPVTAFLVGRKGDSLEVLWRQVVLTSQSATAAERGRITSEIEKRIKARPKR